MKEDLSVVVHPTDNNIRIRHTSIWRDAKSDPAICGHVDTERDGFFGGTEVPVNGIERGAASVHTEYS